MAHEPEIGTPRHGMEARWATLANELALTDAQKAKLEDFMSDLQHAAWDDDAVPPVETIDHASVYYRKPR